MEKPNDHYLNLPKSLLCYFLLSGPIEAAEVVQLKSENWDD